MKTRMSLELRRRDRKTTEEKINDLEELWGDLECRLVKAETGSEKEANIRAAMRDVVSRINVLEKQATNERKKNARPRD